MKKLVLFLGLATAALIALALLRVGPPPRITVAPQRPAIGPRTPVLVTVEAPGRGLGPVRVEVVQGEGEAATTHLLAEESWTPRPFWAFWGPRTPRGELSVEVGRETVEGLRAGEATVRVTAARAGTWLRRPEPAVEELVMPVRLTPPTLGVVSSPNNVAQAGSGVVIYQVGESSVRDGVAAGEWFFPGQPLPGGGAGQRFALYGVPYDQGDPAAIRLVAEDDAGNRSEARFVDTFEARPPTRDVIELSDDFLARVVPPIYAQTPSLTPTGDLLKDYLEVNGPLRRANAEELVRLGENSQPDFLWHEVFQQLPRSQVMSSFADHRTYVYEGEEVDHQDHLGFDLASVRRAPVPAANSGLVVLARYFGIYGNTVVVDHGHGLMSLYAHLSSIGVSEGERVEQGQVLGQTGATGLAGGDHLHFTMLLRGLAVDPEEWWDPHWIRTRLESLLEGEDQP